MGRELEGGGCGVGGVTLSSLDRKYNLDLVKYLVHASRLDK